MGQLIEMGYDRRGKWHDDGGADLFRAAFFGTLFSLPLWGVIVAIVWLVLR